MSAMDGSIPVGDEQDPQDDEHCDICGGLWGECHCNDGVPPTLAETVRVEALALAAAAKSLGILTATGDIFPAPHDRAGAVRRASEAAWRVLFAIERDGR